MSDRGLFDNTGEWLGEGLTSFCEFLACPRYAIPRGAAKDPARAYSLDDDEDEVLEEIRVLTSRARIFSPTKHEKPRAGVDAQLALLPRLALPAATLAACQLRDRAPCA
jgi:hypothetical protein